MLKKINKYLSGTNTCLFIIINVFLLMVIMVLMNGFIDFFNIPDLEVAAPPQVIKTDVYDIVLSICIVPFIETLIFQKLIFWISSKIGFANKSWLVILLSAILFASTHFYSVGYIIYGLMGGAIFMNAYLVRIGKKPFLTIFLIHACSNSIILLLDVFNIYGGS